MSQVKDVFSCLGASSIETYIASGNVAFEHDGVPNLDQIIEDALSVRAGFKVPVVLRTALEWSEVVSGNPFQSKSANGLHVAVSSAPLPEFLQEYMAKARKGEEEFAVVGKTIYLFLPHGFGASKLAKSFSRYAPVATCRNWRTALKLQEMCATAASK